LLRLLSVALSCCDRRTGPLVEALVGTGGDAAAGVMARIKTAQCALQVNVGRIPGTAMPADWAASGAKLGFLLEVEFCDELPADYQMTKERLLLGRRSSQGGGPPGMPAATVRSVEPLNDPTFVSTAGQQVIKVTEGAYGCELQNLPAQQYGFRFFLDFPDGAKRNDVELPAERIYFLSSCWIKNEPTFRRAQQRYDDLDASLEDVRGDIAKLEAEARSSGIIGKAMGLRQMTLLVEKTQRIEAQLSELEQTYPLRDTTRQELLDGPNDLLFVREGVIAVKRFRGAMETREQYHWVGTFSIKEFFEDLDEEDERIENS